MKKTVMKVMLPVILALFLTACSEVSPAETTTQPAASTTAPAVTTQPTTAPTTAPTTETTAPPPVMPVAPEYEGKLAEEDVKTFTELFQWSGDPVNYYNLLMAADFDAPENIDLNPMFYEQDTDEAGPLTEAEKEFLAEQPQIALDLDVVRVSKKKMDATLQTCLGIGLEDTTGIGLEQFAYYEKTGCYYNSKGDFGAVAFEIRGGNRHEDGTVEICYLRNLGWSYCLTLKETENGYHVISNMPWEPELTGEELQAFEDWFNWEKSVADYAEYTFTAGTWKYSGNVELTYEAPDAQKGVLTLRIRNGIYTVLKDEPAAVPAETTAGQ